MKRIPGTFVVNTGEIMKLWTGGIFRSARHRVINMTGRERYSVPFFATPSFDEMLKPLMSNPDPTQAAPDYHPLLTAGTEMLCGDFVQQQFGRRPTRPPDGRPLMPSRRCDETHRPF